ncbi:hypothetical protein [Devosia sp. Root635]|uniref:hypothetical protein n=1 Tax=Devosia sp. Root635 TaxID=1736575 RepID=UPI0006F84CFD|nr:hypothetical protein [Devosia sp. Root635]KRA44668.1 hypothetical protein ASD80_05870 [Devosia sp. Root635]
MPRFVPGQPITVETLEWALDRMAVIMAEAPDQGVTYLPIWQRLERERDALLTQNDAMAAVRARQKRLTVLQGQTLTTMGEYR